MSNLSNFVKRLRDIMRNDAGINGDAQRIEQIAWMLFLKVYDSKEEDWEFDDDDYISIIPENCRWQNWAHDDHSGKAMTGDNLLDFVNNTLFPTLKKLDVTAETPIKKAIVKTTFEDANNYMKDGVLLRQVLNVIDELDLSDYEDSHAFGDIYESILRELQSAGSSGEFYTPRAVTDFMAKMIQPQIGEKVADGKVAKSIRLNMGKSLWVYKPIFYYTNLLCAEQVSSSPLLSASFPVSVIDTITRLIRFLYHFCKTRAVRGCRCQSVLF